MSNKKIDIIIFEPNLDNRKPLAQLLPLSKYVIRFTQDIVEFLGEAKTRTPHIVFLNLDEKKMDYPEFIQDMSHHLPKETVVLGMSTKPDSPKTHEKINEIVQEVIALPIAGLKVKPKINEVVESLKPIEVQLKTPTKLSSEIQGKIVAMGETEFLADFPLKLSFGDQLNIKSEFLDELFSGENKTLIITDHKHAGSTEDQVAVTILGLKNSDLQTIRARILNWDKL
mgnify:CR=1 FL=1